MESRICAKCKKEFPATLEFFHKSSGGKFGLYSSCKLCARKHAREKWHSIRTKRLAQSNKYAATHPERIMWLSAKRRAKNEKLPFTITLKDIVIPFLCPVYKVPLILRDKDWAPTLDKIIPELGYVLGNIEVISRKANRLKNDGLLEDFKKLVNWLVQKQVPEVDYEVWERVV